MALEYDKEYSCVYLRGDSIPNSWFFITFEKGTNRLTGRTGCGAVTATYTLKVPSDNYYDHDLTLTSVVVDTCAGQDDRIKKIIKQLEGTKGTSPLKLDHPLGHLAFHNDELDKDRSEEQGPNAFLSMAFNLAP
ncbi:MAG: hypothetical protein ACN6NZ_03490 [Burkholderiales bacterium]